jgi:uncharacterized protein (DUF983 family)
MVAESGGWDRFVISCIPCVSWWIHRRDGLGVRKIRLRKMRRRRPERATAMRCDQSKNCPHCGEPIRLRSFRPPPLRCPQCGDFYDPQEARERSASIAFFPIFIIAPILVGILGFGVGKLLMPIINVPTLDFRLAFLAGFDGLAFVCLQYWGVVGGLKAKTILSPSAVFLLFMVGGIRCGSGMGLDWLIVWGLVNGTLGFMLAFLLVHKGKPPTSSTV